MQPSRWVLRLAAGWLAFVGAAHAAPPTCDALFPAGAAIGVETKVTISGAVEPWPCQVWCNRPDVQVAPAADKGQLIVNAAPEAPPGMAWLRLWNEEGASVVRPLQIGTIAETLEKEPNNAPREAQPVETLPVLLNGQFEKSGDVDIYAVRLTKGQTLVASLDGHRALGSKLDGVLQILSVAGFVLAHNDDGHGVDPFLVFTAPADGLYLVRTFCFPIMPDSTIGLAGGVGYVYRLTLTTGGYVDHAWPATLTADQPQEVELVGWNLTPETARLTLTGPLGPPVVARHAAWANAVALPTVARPSLVEREPNPVAEPMLLTPPCTVTGRIDPPRDADAFRWGVKKGESWLVRVESRRFGTPLDPVLETTDAAGKRLKLQDDVGEGRDTDVIQPAAEDGELRAVVTDLNHNGGLRYVYRLTVDRPQPDVRLTVAADNFTATTGQPLEIPVTIVRLDGLNEELELKVVGLPDGATADVVKVPMQNGGTQNAKLVIQAASAVAGRIQIQAASATLTTPRLATAPTPVPDTPISDIWLTMKKPAS